MDAPDKIEYARLQTRLEEKDKWIIELQNHNETLKKELEKSSQDKEAVQNLYNNYMLQMQTLINQKAIEAQGAKKSWWKLW
jgi:transcriptional accessory protein Tex/SPT6